MRPLRTVAVLGIAKRIYDEARKPQNQARIRSAIARLQASRRPGRR